MGRFLVFLIIVAAALAGVWFYVPGGKDMLQGAKSTVMGMMPGKADDAADATADVVEETVDAAADATGEAVDDAAAAVDEAADDAAAEEPQN
jgi:hypothetical protein